MRHFKLFFCAVLLYSFYGDRGHTAGEHVNRHDGQHLSEDRRDPERVAETSEWFNDDKQSYCTIRPHPLMAVIINRVIHLDRQPFKRLLNFKNFLFFVYPADFTTTGLTRKFALTYA